MYVRDEDEDEDEDICVISASGLAFRMVGHTYLRIRDD
jgi:hypothetical protein